MSAAIVELSRISSSFKWIKWFNVGFITACISFSSSLISSILQGNYEESLVWIVLLLMMILPTWMAWRNINVINSISNPWSIRALIIVIIIGTLLLVSIAFAAPSAAAGDQISRFTLGAVILLGTCSACMAAVATYRLRRVWIDDLGIRLVDVLRQLRDAEYRPNGVKTVPDRPWLAAFFILLGVEILVGIDFLPFEKLPAHQRPQLIQNISALGFLALLYARSALQPAAKTVLATDKRAPVLLLRSFVDDERISANNSDSTFVDSSLESRLAAHFLGFGPFIAVGAPSDALPVIGAARTQLPTEGWQSQIIEWIDSSSTILLLSGTTHWVDWELRQILKRNAVSKLLIAFPPYKPSRAWKDRATRKFDANMRARFEQLKHSMADTIWAPALSTATDISNLRAIIFDKTGGVTMIKARSRDRNAYHLAIIVAHWLRLSLDGALSPIEVAAARRHGDYHAAGTLMAGVATALSVLVCLSYGAVAVFAPIALASALLAILLLPPIQRAAQNRAPMARLRIGALGVSALLGAQGLAVAGSQLVSEAFFGDARTLTPQSVASLRYAAWSGLPIANLNRGKAYIMGIGVPQDKKLGCEIIRDRARYELAAQQIMGMCMVDGMLPPTATENAASLLLASAAANDPISRKLLGKAYLFGKGGAPIDREKARQYLSPLADAGDADANFHMGLILLGTDAAHPNNAAALPYFRKAAEAGNIDGISIVGVMALMGEGMKVDYDLALRYNRQAAEAGNPINQLDYGVQLMNGSGTKRDPVAARRWLLAAARSDEKQVREVAEKNLQILEATPQE